MGVILAEYKSTGKLLATPAALDREMMIAINGFPGHTKWAGRSLVVRPTGANIEYILDHWPDAAWGDQAAAIRDEYLDKRRAAAELMVAKRGQLRDPGFPYKTIPYDHQEHAFILQRDVPSFALLMDMGTGKTKVAIDTAAYLYMKGDLDAVLVFAWPSGVHELWVDDEFPAHCPCEWHGFIWNGKSGKRRTSEFAAMLGAEDGLKVFTLNLEATRSATAMRWVEQLLKANRTMLIMDESIAIKNPTAKSTAAMTKLGRHRNVRFRRILTGAQVSNSNADVFAQYRFLDPQIIGYDTYTSFKAQYCHIVHPAGDSRREIITGYKNVEELISRIDPFSYRVRKDECLTLPPKVYQRWPFQLHPAEQSAHDQLKAEYMAEVHSQEITAELALVRMMRLQQIASGWWPSPGQEDDPPSICAVPSRFQALMDILKANKGLKAIIWSRFVPDIRYIVEQLNHIKPQCALGYWGECSRDERKAARDRFQSDPTAQFLVAQFQCASRGLTLTAADYVIYYSNQYGLDMRLQSEDRCHRIDEVRMATRSSVPYIDLCAKGTSDAKIIAALRAKRDVADVINRDPPSAFLEYQS